jgi:hypothetical protein
MAAPLVSEEAVRAGPVARAERERKVEMSARPAGLAAAALMAGRQAQIIRHQQERREATVLAVPEQAQQAVETEAMAAAVAARISE